MGSLAGKGELPDEECHDRRLPAVGGHRNVLKMPQLSKITLQNVDFSYEIQDGKMITKPFDVKIDRLTANVGGSTAFADQAIDYTMKAKVPSDMFGADADKLVSGLLGQLNRAVGTDAKLPTELDLTARITGTVDKPIVKPVFGGGGSNLKETVIDEVKAQVNEQIDKVKADAIARARDEAAKLLAEAQKQADDIKAKARSEAANVKAQGYKAADDLVNQTTNPLAKAGAKIAADKAKKAADEQEQKFITEADKRANSIVDAAGKQGDALIQKAENTNTTVK